MGRSRVLTPEGGGDYYRSPAGKVQKPPAVAEYTPPDPQQVESVTDLQQKKCTDCQQE